MSLLSFLTSRKFVVSEAEFFPGFVPQWDAFGSVPVEASEFRVGEVSDFPEPYDVWMRGDDAFKQSRSGSTVTGDVGRRSVCLMNLTSLSSFRNQSARRATRHHFLSVQHEGRLDLPADEDRPEVQRQQDQAAAGEQLRQTSFH